MLDRLCSILYSNARMVAHDELQEIDKYIECNVLKCLASDGRQHPLGFYYYQQEVGVRTNLRFHFWPIDWHVPDDQASGEIHDHIYRLTSLVVLGTIRHETFEAVGIAGGKYRLAQVSYAPSGSTAHWSDRNVELTRASDDTHERGQIYRLERGVLHRASATVAPAITIVLAEDTEFKMWPSIAIKDGAALPPAFARQPLAADQYHAVEDIVRGLSASPKHRP